jgi:hypothetical protein
MIFSTQRLQNNIFEEEKDLKRKGFEGKQKEPGNVGNVSYFFYPIFFLSLL